jgi:hypothetical protein
MSFFNQDNQDNMKNKLIPNFMKDIYNNLKQLLLHTSQELKALKELREEFEDHRDTCRVQYEVMTECYADLQRNYRKLLEECEQLRQENRELRRELINKV